MNNVVANAFLQGHSTRTFMGMNMFSYREDNVQRPIRTSEFKTSSKGVEFKVRFNINEVGFCSRLNQDFITTMDQANYHHDILEALTRDYQVSKRQYAFYLLDCRVEQGIRNLCNKQDINALRNEVNRQFPEQMFMGILFDDGQVQQKDLIDEIERLLRNQFAPLNSKPSRHDPNINKKDMTGMFKQNFTSFIRYLHEDLAPKIDNLQKIFYKHKFESPLDFIMIKSDFKRFYESFTQARLSLLYSLELHKDSLFTLNKGREQNQLALSRKLYKNF